MHDDLERRLTRARQYGFSGSHPPAARFEAKPASHDDGPGHGMFLGGIGAPAFSRDLDGRFSRWHLEPGAHVLAEVPACLFEVHWRDEHGDHVRALRRDAVTGHEVLGLFPYWHEVFTDDGMPFRVVLTAFSPVVPGDAETAAQPVVCFEVELQPLAGPLPAVDVALYWANLNGWRASRVTTTDRGGQAWPGHHHAGNRNRAVPSEFGGLVVAQGREGDLHGPAGNVGEVALAVHGDAASYTRQVQFKTDQNATGVPEHQQSFTFAAVRHAFARTGRLGETPDGEWPAHWHEPVGSALAAHHEAGKAGAFTRFTLAFDWPYVVFGQGRAWRRRYLDTTPHDAPGIALRAQRAARDWKHAIDTWQDGRLAALTGAGWPPRVAGCVLNELGLVTSLGTVWVRGTVPGHEPGVANGPDRTEHFGLLEGFDTGYFYVNTSDLWHYAFVACARGWPELADVVFADLRGALRAEHPERRPIYRPAEYRKMLAADRLPHDLGAVQEDPFVRLNGYSMRDDPNTWRDANPAFVLASLVRRRLSGDEPTEQTWRDLRAAAEIVAADAGALGVSEHAEFGDSTWDNLGLRGHSTYATALSAGMWAALAAHGRARGEQVSADEQRLAKARAVLDSLWTGEYYRACSQGKYTRALMPDSLFGVFYAELAGAQPVLPRERIERHLRSAYEIAYRGYHDGRVGPLLIAEPGVPRYSRDGGEELQVNEVLLGSAWMFVAMLHWYGLRAEAAEVSSSLCDVLYGATGLQYRTPAAVDGDGHFRAPLNMRPLAVWWLEVASDPAFRRS